MLSHVIRDGKRVPAVIIGSSPDGRVLLLRPCEGTNLEKFLDEMERQSRARVVAPVISSPPVAQAKPATAPAYEKAPAYKRPSPAVLRARAEDLFKKPVAVVARAPALQPRLVLDTSLLGWCLAVPAQTAKPPAPEKSVSRTRGTALPEGSKVTDPLFTGRYHDKSRTRK